MNKISDKFIQLVLFKQYFKLSNLWAHEKLKPKNT